MARKKSRLWIRDRVGGENHLIDTGAEVSLEAASDYDRKHAPRGLSLQAANGSAIATFGERTRTVHIGTKTLVWRFVVADVSSNIIGADFLAHHNLLVDMRRKRLLDATTFEVIRVDSAPTDVDATDGIRRPSVADVSHRFQNVVGEFPSTTNPETLSFLPKHDVTHFIETTGPPVRSHARPLRPDRLAEAKKEFEDLEAMGIVRRSNSPWASPLHLVEKPDGTWRPTGDYRRLNGATIDDRYSIPRIQDFTAQLAGKVVFSKIDLVRGYYQIPMAPGDVAKTAIITPFGLWEFLRMPFGLKCAAQTFQRFMDRVTQGLRNVFVYLDDVLIASSNEAEHEEDLRALFASLEEHGLVVKTSKCIFGVDSIDFLGHRVDRNGIIPLPEKVRAVREFPSPSSVADLQRFLGMLNFYHRFVPRVAGIVVPLTRLLAGRKKHDIWKWEKEHQVAFEAAKSALADATQLVHPVKNAPLALTVDASDYAVGGVLEQHARGMWQPLGYFSRKLQEPRETKYPTFDRELLAAHLATRHFRYFIEGRSFSLFSDQDSLIPSMRITSDKQTNCQTSQSIRLTFDESPERTMSSPTLYHGRQSPKDRHCRQLLTLQILLQLMLSMPQMELITERWHANNKQTGIHSPFARPRILVSVLLKWNATGLLHCFATNLQANYALSSR